MFQDKTVLITGASSGLGAALALELADRGANLALFSFEAERQEEVAARCRERGARAVAVIGDVTHAEDCRGLVGRALSEYGSVDALIANAGISMWSRFDQVEDPRIFRKLMEVNYLGAVNCIQAALPHLRQSRGQIVAITSIQARIGVPLHTGYVASKHALQGFCESLRMELEDTGVNILTVLPHWLRGTELRSHAFGGDGATLGETSHKHSSESITLEAACTAIVNAMAQRKRELVMPWKLRVLLAVKSVFPALADSIIMRAVRKQGGSSPADK